MISKIKLILIAGSIIFGGCLKDKAVPFDQIWVGMTKNEITKLVGPTVEKRFITKKNNQIQGPETEFWDEIPRGTKLEVWTYNTPGGKLNLYFIGKDSELKYRIDLK